MWCCVRIRCAKEIWLEINNSGRKPNKNENQARVEERRWAKCTAFAEIKGK